MTTKNSKSVQHLQSININDEYGTPTPLYRKALFDFDLTPILDVCATELNRKCLHYFDLEHDALKQNWNEDFFMNPPYSRITEFISKAHYDSKRFNVDGLILVYAKTDTKWWHEHVEGIAEVHFIKGRIKFNDANGIKTKNSAPYPSCWIIYRKSKTRMEMCI